MTKSPNLWTSDSTISISRAIYDPVFEIGSFIFFDTIAAVALGTPPLLNYDTTYELVHPPKYHFIETIYGCPAHVTIILAQINRWRASRWLEQPDSAGNTWREVEELSKSWIPAVDSEADSHNLIGRFAVQESWQHAVSIYLYMVSKYFCCAFLWLLIAL